jgi:ABC-type oligopeptide transport system ATPase subunit
MALRKVRFEVGESHCLGVVGESGKGSGKTVSAELWQNSTNAILF